MDEEGLGAEKCLLLFPVPHLIVRDVGFVPNTKVFSSRGIARYSSRMFRRQQSKDCKAQKKERYRIRTGSDPCPERLRHSEGIDLAGYTVSTGVTVKTTDRAGGSIRTQRWRFGGILRMLRTWGYGRG